MNISHIGVCIYGSMALIKLLIIKMNKCLKRLRKSVRFVSMVQIADVYIYIYINLTFMKKSPITLSIYWL